MTTNEKSIQEINEKIRDGSVCVVTAAQMTQIVAEMGPEDAMHEVDVVTTGTFGAMCSSGVWMNFGHAEPPMKMSKVWLNDVEAYAAIAAVDAYLGATQPSSSLGIEYGGGHVFEDLIRGKTISLKAEGTVTDCYPNREFSVEIGLEDLNQAVMSNPRNCYERYAVAANSSKRDLYTYMGKLLPELENATYSGAGELAPILNDPQFRTIGIGTRILLGGGEGYVIGNGTQHNPTGGFGTLMVQGDLKKMNSSLIRGATMSGYGPTLYVGVGVPIPIINADVARSAGISDVEITTTVYDYAVPSRNRPALSTVSYAELKSGMIDVGGREVRTSPLSSFKVAHDIALQLKDLIAQKEFFISEAVKPLSTIDVAYPLRSRKSTSPTVIVSSVSEEFMHRNTELCINCGLCVPYCKTGVFQQDSDWIVTDDTSLCVECGECSDICPQRAITVRS
ncbi:MAG: homocysteine biosynthesis protein [Candidatus Thorarchaeota archaeon]